MPKVNLHDGTVSKASQGSTMQVRGAFGQVTFRAWVENTLDGKRVVRRRFRLAVFFPLPLTDPKVVDESSAYVKEALIPSDLHGWAIMVLASVLRKNGKYIR